MFTINNGLSEDVVRTISEYKNEPEWMTDIRVKAYQQFIKKPMPVWGNTEKLSTLDFDEICYFRVMGENKNDWDEVPDKIKRTFDALGIPEAEQKWLGGLTAQYDFYGYGFGIEGTP